MTVRTLIEFLKRMPLTSPVMLTYDNGYAVEAVVSVRFDEARRCILLAPSTEETN